MVEGAASVSGDLLKKINDLRSKKIFTDDIFDEFFRRLNPPEHVQNQGVKLNYDTKIK